VGLWRGVRTHRYTYARWKDCDGRRILYDLQEDPLEMQNLIHDPAYAGLAERLEARLQEWMETTGDPFDTGERLPVTEMLDVGQAFTTTKWHQLALREYVAAIEGNHLNFETGEQPGDETAFSQ
jgi:hypothetical protein